ncbi:hypothetical protein OEZ86_011352 [Tetradesmus obliquus]|nr:hypothetical protein OEZ86_011352 [Tetradesmus obliquus]
MSAGALLSDCSFDFLSVRDRLSKDAVSSSGDRDASHRRSKCDQGKGSALFDGVPHGAYSAGNDIMSSAMFSPFANSFRQDSGAPVLGGVNSDGSSSSDLSAGVATSPVGGLSGYSPFMGVPWGNTVPAYLSEPPAGPLEMPSSPMSPGVTFNPSPSPSGLGAPGSPRSLFSSHSPNPYGALGGGGVNNMRSAGSLQMHGSFTNAHSASLAAADAAAAAAAAAALNQLPSFYYQAAAAAAGGAGAAANNLSLQAALSQSLMSQHTANLAAVQQQQMQQHILQASLSAAFSQANNPYLQGYPSAVLSSALEPMRSAGGSLSLDGGLQHQASAAAAAAALLQHQQQQHHQHAAAQLRRNLSTPAAVAAQLQLSSAAAAASASLCLSHPLSASASALSPLTAQMGRLHVTHSADLSHLDAAALLGSGSMGQMAAARSQKFKARKNSEPKIGPDGQPRLNARQRRTLRRAKERALKGLLEVSQALLQKAEVQVTVPNISHLTALEELAAVEAEKEAAASEHAARHPDTSMSSDQAGKVGGKSAGGQTRSQQLAAAAAAVEESVCEIARAAVAAVTAQATGKDTSSAAAAAKAAAANAASAAASAGAVLPPNFVMPEHEEPNSDELPGCEGMMDCCSNSAPTSPVGSSATAGEPSSSSGRSSSSSSSGGATSSRCSSSSGGSSNAAPSSGKPPIGSKAGPPPALVTASSLGSPLVSPSPSPTPAVAAGKGSMSSQLEGIDIAGLIGQLSLKKDEGMVDDKLIRDLQIIQSLIGALKAPSTSPGLESASSLTSPGMLPSCSDGRRGGANPRVSGGGVGGAKGSVAPKRANSYSPGSGLSLHPSLPH